jgi:hypothetical protein
MTKRQLRIGDRVRFIGGGSSFHPGDKRTGTVVRVYRGWDDIEQLNGSYIFKPLPYPERWHASIHLDVVPDGWPYSERMCFAPAVDELELIRGLTS